MMMMLMMQKALYIAICKKQLFRLQKQGGIMAFFQFLCFHDYDDDDDDDEKGIIHCNLLNVQLFSL